MMKEVGARFVRQNRALVILLLIAILSILVAQIVTKPAFNAKINESLEEKKVVVMRLAGAAAAASTAISFLPGDAGGSIANELARLSVYFIIVLSSIILQKVLLAAIGYASFVSVIPLSCFLGILYTYTREMRFKMFAIKLAVLGICLFVMIPASVQLSDLIATPYQNSIEGTIEYAEQNMETIEETKEDIGREDKNWWQNAGEYISNVTSSIGNGIAEMIKKGEDTLSAFLDAIAIMIITSCVVPFVTMLAFVWIIKMIMKFDIGSVFPPIPPIGSMVTRRPKHEAKSL